MVEAFGRRGVRRIPLPVVVAALGLAVVAAVYARSLDNYFQSDDFDWLYNYGLRAVESGTVGVVLALPDSAAVDPSNPATWLYRPTTYALVNLLFRLFGAAAPAGYHAILLVAHLVVAGLAGAIAVRLTRRPWVGSTLVVVFGLHFAHVETVAWFGSIAEMLAAALGLAAVLAFLQFRESSHARWAWIATLAYGLALGANPTAGPIIGVFALVDVWRFARGAGRRRSDYWPYIPLVTLAGAYLAVHAAALGVASGGGGYGYSLGAHVLLNAIWYPVVLVAPFTEPELFDIHHSLRGVLDGSGSLDGLVALARFGPVLVAHLVVIGAVILVAVRGPGWARVSVGAALLLEAPFVLLGGTMFHFAYLPAAFLLTLGVAALAGLGGLVADRARASPRLVVAPFVAVACLLAWQTHGRLDDWEFASGLSHRLVRSAHAVLADPAPNAWIVATGLPNTVNGAYVFREGFPAALQVTYGRTDLRVQVFSRPTFQRLLASAPAAAAGQYFLAYDTASMALRPEIRR